MFDSLLRKQILSLLHDPWRWQVYTTLLPGEVQPMSETRHERWSAHHSHRHPYREILVPLSGNTVYGVNGTIYPCKTGCDFFLDGRDVHDVFYPAFAPELEHLWITVLQGRDIVRWVNAGHGKQDASAGVTFM